MREQVMEILTGIRTDVDFNNVNQKLIDDKVLDSFDIIAIVSEFNDAFDVEISAEELLPENFNTVDAMVELITGLKED